VSSHNGAQMDYLVRHARSLILMTALAGMTFAPALAAQAPVTPPPPPAPTDIQAPPAPTPATTGDAVLTEARLAYDATDYERARVLIDAVIAGLGSTPTSPEQRQVIAAAYELRARTRFNLRDLDGARTDFRAMLLLDPTYLLAEQVNPRVLALFEEVKKTTVGTVTIVVSPADAQVTLNNARLASDAGSMVMVGGTYTLSASRTGYASTTQAFTVIPGTDPQTVTLSLERISSMLSFVTSPANIEVIIDGASRGRTELDPGAKTEGGGLLSKPFVVTDLQNGRHRVELRRDCFIGTERNLDVPRAGDYTLETVRLMPAVATVSVTSSVPGATVFVDDAPRGTVPATLNDICQGQHTIEVRSAYGRHLRRMDLKAGQEEVFGARVRPAFAIISDSGASNGVRGGADLRLMAESAFQESSSITLFAPSEKVAAEVLASDNLPADWMAFDMLRKPIGQAASIGDQARGTLAASISRKLNAQGIAAVARDPSGEQGAMLLILLAPGSAEPDVIRWRPDSPQSLRETLRELDAVLPLFRASIGVVAVDVQDVDGVVVAAVEPGSTAEGAGLQPGDTIVSASGSPVNGAIEFAISIGAKAAGQPLPIELRDRTGMMRKLEVAVQAVPNVVSIADQDLPANRLAIEYAYRAASLSDALEETAVRLNVGALALRLRNRTEAIRELERVLAVLGEGRVPASLTDAIGGTAHYLIGLAAEANGDLARAETAWRQAAQSRGSLLIDSGSSPIKELAEQRLSQASPAQPGRR
jgi:hypothetical protein